MPQSNIDSFKGDHGHSGSAGVENVAAECMVYKTWDIILRICTSKTLPCVQLFCGKYKLLLVRFNLCSGKN